MSLLLRRAVALWLLALPLLAPAFAQAPPTAVPGPALSTPAASAPPVAAQAPGAELEALLRVLRDETQRAALLRALEAARTPSQAPPPATTPDPAATPAEPAGSAASEARPRAAGEEEKPAETPLAPAETVLGITQRAGLLVGHFVSALLAATQFEGVWNWAHRVVTEDGLRGQVASLAWRLALVLLAGFAVERALRWLLRRPDAVLGERTRAEDRQISLGRRGLYLLAHLLLDLIPVAGLLAAALTTVWLLATWPSTRVIMETVAIGYAVARAVMAVARVFFAPASARLRILPVSDETAEYATLWIHRLALTTVGFYAASELALLFGLSYAVHQSIWRMGLLAVSLLIAIIVLQNRSAIAGLLRAPALAEGEEPDTNRRILRAARDRLAEAWHVIVILWLLIAWTLWALQVERGLERLASASGLTVLILIGAKLLDEGVRLLLTRAFRVGPELAQRYPGLEARANRYLPALKGAISAAIVAFAIVLLLESWGLPAFAFFRQGRPGSRLVTAAMTVVVTLVAALIAWELANAAIQRNLAALPKDAAAARSARVRTLLPMLRTVIAIVLILVVALTTLAEIGVNVAPLLAGAGVVGLAIGFGSQTLVRDIITGVFLLLEDAIAVGDSITVGGLSGTVEQLSIRSIRLRAVDGSIHIVPFSAVTTVTNQTRDFGYAVIDLNLDYSCDPDAAAAMLRDIGAELLEDEAWAPSVLAPIEVMGVDKLTDTSMVVRARIMTPPTRRWAVAREINRRIRLQAGERGVKLYAAARPA
jgi:small-conductance mechanosensitive channel